MNILTAGVDAEKVFTPYTDLKKIKIFHY